MPFNPNAGGGGPSLGGLGGVQWGHDLVNSYGFTPDSPMRNWIDAMQPDQMGWQGGSGGGAPGHLGQDYMYNSRTGEGSWTNRPGVDINGNSFSGIDPVTGNQYYNLDQIGGIFGDAGGGTGYNKYQMTDYGGADVTAPGAYAGGNWSRPENLSAKEVIESYRPTMQNEIDLGFAEAGNRLGQSGFANSGAYAGALGDVERLARAQMNQRALEFGYDADKFDRNQALQRQLAQNAEGFQGWQTQGGWDLQSQLANAGNAMTRWQAENNYGFQDNQNENMYNQQNDQNRQSFMAQILAGIL